VNERWVCKRCFADNDGSAGSCVRCGLARGAEATEGDKQAWAAQAAASADARAQPGWRRWARFWWVPALAIVLVVGYLASARRDEGGQITAGGTLSIEDLQVGDCFNFSEDEEEISQVDARRCDEAHGYELFHVATWTGSSTYPSEDQMLDFIIDECVPAFGRYVGEEYQTSVLDFVHFAPVPDGWDAGDRVFQCALFDPDSETVTTSLEGAAR
jgi:hypothetical protein